MKRIRNSLRQVAVNLAAFVCLLLSAQVFGAPPTVPGAPSGSVSGQQVTLQWTASRDDNRVAGYNVYLNEQYLTTVFDTTFTGLLDTSEANVFYIIAFDEPRAGESVAYSARSPEVVLSANSTTVSRVPDTQKPSRPRGLTAVSTSSSAVRIRWTPSTDNIRVAGYNVYRNGVYRTTVFSETFTDSNPLPQNINNYSVVAFDVARNFSETSEILRVQAVDSPPPVTPPGGPGTSPPAGADSQPPSAPGGLTVSSASAESIAFRWNPSSDNVGVVGYGIFRDGRFIASVRNATRFEDLRLPGTASRYTYTVSAYDAAFNFSKRSAALSVSIAETPPVNPPPSEEDVTAPSTPAGLRVLSADRSRIVFSWNASMDNVGVIGYSIFRNGRYIAAVRDGTRYEDDQLPETGSDFTYTVRAYDAKFNFSGVSAPLTVSTNPTPPVPTPEVLPRSDIRGLDRLYAYRPASPYASVLKRCALAETEDTRCPLSTLPYIGQNSTEVSRSDIMDRLLVTHDWMGERFMQFLNDAPADMIQLFGSVTTIRIGSTVRPSNYRSWTGAITLDPSYLWLSVPEKATISIEDDFRSDYGRDLQFWSLGSMLKDGARATSFFSLQDYSERSFSDIRYRLSALMFHELGHAVDYVPLSRLTALNSDLTPKQTIEQLSDIRVSINLYQNLPLYSQLMFELADVRFRGKQASEQQKNLTEYDVGAEMAIDGATEFYSYSTVREDMANLFEAFMMKKHFDIDMAIAFTRKPDNTESYSCSELLVGWGVNNRLADPLVAPRAKWVVDEVFGASVAHDEIFNSGLGAAREMTPGVDWCNNLQNLALSARTTVRILSKDIGSDALERKRLMDLLNSERRPRHEWR